MEYIGKLVTGDFSDNTMTFEIEGQMTLQAGRYKIIPIEVGNKDKCDHDYRLKVSEFFKDIFVCAKCNKVEY